MSATAGVTVRGGNPQIGATSVEDDLELLGRGAKGDSTVVLGVLVVVDDNGTVLTIAVRSTKKITQLNF